MKAFGSVSFRGVVRGFSTVRRGGDDGGDHTDTTISRTAVACRYCLNAKETGMEAEFHCCVYDAVVTAFRTKAGPIARPVKESDYKGPARV